MSKLLAENRLLTLARYKDTFCDREPGAGMRVQTFCNLFLKATETIHIYGHAELRGDNGCRGKELNMLAK